MEMRIAQTLPAVDSHVIHRLLLDVSSLMYRAFFALPKSIKGSTGAPVNVGAAVDAICQANGRTFSEQAQRIRGNLRNLLSDRS